MKNYSTGNLLDRPIRWPYYGNYKQTSPLKAAICETDRQLSELRAQNKTESEDTKIRKNIYAVINKMIKEGKSDVQIEIYLTNLYPNYSEYILKMISHQFSKIDTTKSADSKDGKKGEAR